MTTILLLGITGYALILYGGKLVVDEQALVLDAATTIETKDGDIIGKIYHENRDPVDIEKIPEHVQNAFIAIEDNRFYQHSGIDLRSVGRAIYRDIMAGSKVEGASTITQQLAKNLFLSQDKTWMRKTKEVMAAIYLERNYSKKQLLELYLNQMYFGHGVYGVEMAAQKFFSKSVEELSLTEGALLAGLGKAPNGYSPINHPEKALERRNLVLRAMDASKMISTKTRIQAQEQTLGVHVQKEEKRPWLNSYLDLVTKEAAEKYQLSIRGIKRGGYRIVVNVDETAQKIAYRHFQDDQYFPGNTPGVEGAFVMAENTSGRIVAAIGGRQYQLGDLNRLTVKRQPGSTMKPIAVYGPAMMTKKYTPYSVLPDQKMVFDGYSVANSDHQYDGNISLYQALMKSKNTSAVWLLNQIGVEYAKEYLEKMDISLSDNGLAIALGGLRDGISPIQLAKAYSALANNGEAINLYAIERIYDKNNELLSQAKEQRTEVFSPQVAWDITEILVSTVKEGTAAAGNFSKALAGKTGTTQHPTVQGKSKDIWFVGYTPEYITSLWIGYDKSDKEHFLEGTSSYPTKLVKAILTDIDNRQPLVEVFKKPADVVDLPKPIELPEITDVHATFEWGGFSILRGRLTWTGSDDERVMYRIYRKKSGIDERVGEVQGKKEYVVTDISLFQSEEFYVVPYDPLTKLEGKRSKIVQLSF